MCSAMAAPGRRHPLLQLLLLAPLLSCVLAAQLRSNHLASLEDGYSPSTWLEHSISVECTPDEMLITITPKASGVSFLENDIYSREATGFSGSIYPRGLGKAGGCLTRYRHSPSPIMYRLPLRACNTMPYTLDDGSVEYRNVLMVQPHPRLVTGLGRSHQVSCKPPAPSSISAAALDAQPKAARLSDFREEAREIDLSTHPSDNRPSYSMKIYKGDPAKKEIATNVKIGDPLTLVISIDKELNKHGMKVTDCTVRDGLGWSQQNLLNDDGCPLDNEIMGMFYYSGDGSHASVTFQAHKFPYTASVYYQCTVKLCGSKDSRQCDPACTGGKSRPKRQADSEESPAKIEVFSGLYVNEATDLTPDTDFVTKEKNPEDAICISQRNFAIAICIAGLILMLAVVAAILVIFGRRRGRGKSLSNTASSIYSGPYTNTGYSHTS